MNINRRRFCQSTLASSVVSAFPATIILAQSNESAIGIPARIPAVTLNGADTAIEGAAARELGESLQGSLLLQGDYGYDGARRVWNSQHDRYPALIVRARSAEDVSNAVTFARERELLVAVKGGGHSWPGRSVADGALMIDLSEIKDVLVDVAGRRAKAGGGALLYNLDFETTKHGLVTTGGVVSHTGVGGYTLGGGYGRLNRKFGLTIDNLLSAQVVSSDGQVRRVSAHENADLFGRYVVAAATLVWSPNSSSGCTRRTPSCWAAISSGRSPKPRIFSNSTPSMRRGSPTKCTLGHISSLCQTGPASLRWTFVTAAILRRARGSSHRSRNSADPCRIVSLQIRT